MVVVLSSGSLSELACFSNSLPNMVMPQRSDLLLDEVVLVVVLQVLHRQVVVLQSSSRSLSPLWFLFVMSKEISIATLTLLVVS